jgi:hypothetical protein
MSLVPNWTTMGRTCKRRSTTAVSTASLNAKAPIGHDTLSPAPLMGHPLSLLLATVLVANGLRVLLLTRAWL